MRVGKLVKVSKVRDLPKSLNAVKAAITKTNLAWAGIETQTADKALQDLVPVVESVVENLTAVSEILDQIHDILNPKPGSVQDKGRGGRGKKRFGRAVSKVKAAKSMSRKDLGRADDKPESGEVVPFPHTPTTKGADVQSANIFSMEDVSSKVRMQNRAGRVGGQQVMVNKVVRKLRDNKVRVDADAQKAQSEFGGNAIELLKLEREQPIGEVRDGRSEAIGGAKRRPHTSQRRIYHS